MRYKLDSVGYVLAVSFGCYLDNCTEYTGAVPSGYKSLDDWATNACIQAYYIDQKGNLTLDSYRKNELEKKQEKEAIDYSPVLRKDIFEFTEVLDSQYVRKIETGKVITLEDIKTIATRVIIKGVELGYNKLSVYTQGKNMLRCDAVSCNTCGVTFTRNMNGSLSVLGTATENIEYVIADGKDTTLFALKANTDYYLNLGGLQCELRYFDGETTAQQYIGSSGKINLPRHIEVTQVVIKLHSGEPINTTFYPQLEVGSVFTSYKEYKGKALEIDIGQVEGKPILPSDTLYAKDTLYPGSIIETIDYILIENGRVYVSVGGEVKAQGNGSVGLFSDYSTIYATKDVTLEVEYSDNVIDVDSLAFLQGKSTTTNRFTILKDGSIEAHNGYFSGKIEADSGYFNGVVGGVLKGGSIEIGNYFSVDSWGNCIANSFTSSNAQITGGSIAINTSSSEASAIQLNCRSYSSVLAPAGMNFKSTSHNANITSSGITVTSYSETTSILPGSIRTNTISAMASKLDIMSPVQIYGATTLSIGYTHKVQGTLECSGIVKCTGTGEFSIGNNMIEIGGYRSRVGFFGDSGATKKSVSEIYSTSSATASSVATKLNELIKALKGYNLV